MNYCYLPRNDEYFNIFDKGERHMKQKKWKMQIYVNTWFKPRTNRDAKYLVDLSSCDIVVLC